MAFLRVGVDVVDYGVVESSGRFEVEVCVTRIGAEFVEDAI